MSDSNKKKVRRIVLTGGPGGGKTTAADLFRRELGDSVVSVPESATMLFSGGFPRSDYPHTIKYTQQAIYHVQRNLEDIHSSIYHDRTLLCDRGTIDGAAYWHNGEDDFFSFQNTTLENELKRYDGVIFFETAAVGGLEIESGNPHRSEDLKTAISLDGKLRKLWEQHPEFHLVTHHKSFIKKINNGLSAIQDVLNKLS